MTHRTALTELPWTHCFVDALPGDPEKQNRVRQVRAAAYSEVLPTAVREPRLLGWSEALAEELGIERPLPSGTGDADPNVALLGGCYIVPGMKPYAARYGGHQFGHWAGQLGDGRALTLGEAVVPGSSLSFEFQLKGAGPTPYSRSADGRAVLRSSMREFLCSEAMHHLGVPTTRALSLVTSGDPVLRDMFYDGHPRLEPGAIVCRVAPSFLRFGNFELLAASQETELLKSLFTYMIDAHFPEIDARAPNAVASYFDTIARRTAHMIVQWMRVGFVHGVMNTDNMSALGLTIDYGPYGWLEPYEPGWTPNTTDAQGRRYRFGHQPQIAQWNLACLAGALSPLVSNEETLQAGLETYGATFEKDYERTLAEKCGWRSLEGAGDEALVQRLLGLLQRTETDYTVFFRRLSEWPLTQPTTKQALAAQLEPALSTPEVLLNEPDLAGAWLAWFAEYAERSLQDAPTPERQRERAQRMNEVNPKYVLRNSLAQQAITQATAGDASFMERLLRVLARPYDEQPEAQDLFSKRPEWARSAPGCSALSCSS